MAFEFGRLRALFLIAKKAQAIVDRPAVQRLGEGGSIDREMGEILDDTQLEDAHLGGKVCTAQR